MIRCLLLVVQSHFRKKRKQNWKISNYISRNGWNEPFENLFEMTV